MIVLEWVEMSPCGFTLVSDVTKLVDMEAVQAWGQTRDGSAEAEMEEDTYSNFYIQAHLCQERGSFHHQM